MTIANPDLASQFQSLERQLVTPEIRRNASAVAALLAEDFREFGKSGRIFTRQQIIDELAAEAPRTITLSHFECQLLSPESALVTYRSSTTGSGEALRSSLWVFRDDRWQMLFHQGTKIPA